MRALKAMLLGAAGAACFLPSLKGGFLNWDDRDLVLENPVVQAPLVEAPRIAFASPRGGAYWPLRDLSYALDRAVWGLGPTGFHLTNLVLYGALCAGLYLAARRRFGEGAAFLGGLLFAVHPLHAEAACWISGRKDLLAGVFLVLSWWALEAEGRPGPLRLGLGLLAFALACLSKSAVLSFPLALWALDFFLPPPVPRWTRFSRFSFVVVMVLAAAVQARLSLRAGSAGVYTGLGQALIVPIRALCDQFGAMLLPFRLSPAYPSSDASWGLPRILGLGMLAAVLLGLRPGRTGARPFLAGMAWAMVLLLPVINLGLASSLPRADRYALLPSAGLCLGLGSLWAARARSRALAGACACLLALLSVSQSRTWVSDPAL